LLIAKSTIRKKLVAPFFPGGWQVKLTPPWDERQHFFSIAKFMRIRGV
jgi:hypothetical protein